MLSPTASATPVVAVPWYRHLYLQVVVAIVIGILLGHFEPKFAVTLQPLGDAFIKLVKMIIAPVIFLTIVTGIAGMTHLRSVGRVFAKAMAYFLFFSTLALVVGMFLIYNTVMFSVVQRRPILGTLRALGVTQGQEGMEVTSSECCATWHSTPPAVAQHPLGRPPHRLRHLCPRLPRDPLPTSRRSNPEATWEFREEP